MESYSSIHTGLCYGSKLTPKLKWLNTKKRVYFWFIYTLVQVSEASVPCTLSAILADKDSTVTEKGRVGSLHLFVNVLAHKSLLSQPICKKVKWLKVIIGDLQISREHRMLINCLCLRSCYQIVKYNSHHHNSSKMYDVPVLLHNIPITILFPSVSLEIKKENKLMVQGI